jgi:hypothetical protein
VPEGEGARTRKIRGGCSDVGRPGLDDLRIFEFVTVIFIFFIGKLDDEEKDCGAGGTRKGERSNGAERLRS